MNDRFPRILSQEEIDRQRARDTLESWLGGAALIVALLGATVALLAL